MLQNLGAAGADVEELVARWLIGAGLNGAVVEKSTVGSC